MTASVKALLRSAAGRAPGGDRLSDVRWGLRQRAMLWALWLHVPVMLLVGSATGQDLWLLILAVGLLGVGALAASSPVFSRQVRTLLAVVALLSFSAWLVHVTGGVAESHLHFFAVVAVVLLYQEWMPVAAALAYVAVHYGVFGVLFPAEVYSSEAARDRPIVWAFIYAGFMVIVGLACLAAWRLAGAERAVVGRMLDAVGAGIYGVDGAGRITFVNAVLCAMVGKERKELEGADHHLALGHQLPAGGPVEAGGCRLCAALSGAEEITGETYLGGSGETAAVPVEYVTRPAGSAIGDLGSVITVRDLRERHAWKALRRQAEAERDQLASIAQASPDVALIGRSDGQLVWMNAAGRKMLGFSRDEDIAAYRIEDLFSPAEMARIHAEDMPVLAREGDWQGEWTLQARDGTQFPVLVTQHMHRDDAGKDSYVSGTMRDLRPQRAEERRLRESERRLSAAELVAGMGSWEWDPATDKARSSPGLVQLLGLDPDREGDADSWRSLIHPDDLQMALDRTEEALSAGTPLDLIYRMVRADGRQLSVHCRGEMVAHEQGSGRTMLGTLLDVTDQHAASEALRASEELARSVIATAGSAYIRFGSDGLVTEWNRQAETTFGRARAEVLGLPFSSLVLAAGSREPFERRIGLRGTPGGGGLFEMSMLHRCGNEIPVEVNVWTIKAGGATVFNCSVHDISERHAVQRAKDEFLSVVGHELRTPLTSIHGALGLLRAGLLGELNDRGKQMVGIAAHNTDRLVRLINDILDIERLNSGTVLLECRECDIAELGKRSVEAMRPMAEAAGVHLEIHAHPGILQADPDRIEQTLTNLLSNAIKFSPAGTAVRLTTRMDGDEVEVQVQDRGRGIPPEHLELIFDRFQQVDGSDAREKGGTGLGLAICRTIVQQHGGRIWAESEPGRGAVLTFRLPVTQPSKDPATVGGPTVLIGGNDASGRATVAAMLGPHGYATIDMPSAAGLLAAVTTHRPILILLELRMPVTDDWQVALELLDQTETRDIPVVFLSLHGDNEATGKAGPAGGPSTGPDNPVGPGGLFAAVESAVSSRAAGPTLLLVEDDEGLALVLTERFRHLGIEVHHAPTAQRALAMCAHLVPDLLVLDLLLPDQDGYAVVAQLRRDARLRGMPLAVYTAYDLSEADRQRLRLGPTEFFTKGRVSPDEFERHVVDLLNHLTQTEEDSTHA